MSWKIYNANDYILSLAGLYIFEEWTSIVVKDTSPSHTFEVGVHGEPFTAMSRDNSVSLVLTMPQQSIENDSLELLYGVQKLGTLGVPMALMENKSLVSQRSPSERRDMKIIFPVTFLTGRPDRNFSSVAGELEYKLQATDQYRILL